MTQAKPNGLKDSPAETKDKESMGMMDVKDKPIFFFDLMILQGPQYSLYFQHATPSLQAIKEQI